MTRSLMLTPSGDLSILGRSSQLVSGREKLLQDLNCWLRERITVDRFHRAYGSILESFIGSVVDETTIFDIEAEVMRVLRNYQQLQLRRINENPKRFSKDELLEEIVSVRAESSYDRIDVKITIKSASDRYSNLSVGVST